MFLETWDVVWSEESHEAMSFSWSAVNQLFVFHSCALCSSEGVKLLLTDQQCFLFTSCYIIYYITAQRHMNHSSWQNAFILFIHYLCLYLLIFWLFNNPEYDQSVFKTLKLFIGLIVSVKQKSCDISNLTLRNFQPHMEMTTKVVKYKPKCSKINTN